MKTEEIQKQQDKLDEELVECPLCGKEEKWGFLRKWLSCSKCVEEEMRDREIPPNPENLEIVFKKTHYGKTKCPFCGKEFLIK